MVTVIYAIVAAAIALGILIVFHEFGHFIVAKKSGVGVLTFSIGFGPKLFKKKVGETEYAVSAIPFGGYVKMVGEDAGDEVTEFDVHKSFSHQSLIKRAMIVAAGPVFNLLLAVGIYTLIYAFIGVAFQTTRVGGVNPDLPAAKAGMQKGDLVVAINGRAVKRWEDLSKTIRESGGAPLNLRLQRDGQEIEVAVQPQKSEERNILGEKIEWVLGIQGNGDFVVEKIAPWSAAGLAFVQTRDLSIFTLATLYRMVKGDLSPKNLGGPIMIARVAGQQAREGLTNFFALLAVLSVNLGVLNLLPIPVLDGGHLLFFLIEGILGRPVGEKQRERAQQVGVALLILVMAYAFYNDITRFFEG
jgi:regulator of sigma E protease